MAPQRQSADSPNGRRSDKRTGVRADRGNGICTDNGAATACECRHSFSGLHRANEVVSARMKYVKLGADSIVSPTGKTTHRHKSVDTAARRGAAYLSLPLHEDDVPLRSVSGDILTSQVRQRGVYGTRWLRRFSRSLVRRFGSSAHDGM